MNKIAKLTITTVLTSLASMMFAGHVYAANVSVRVEQPKSPTNQNDFPVNFVALDLLGRTVTVKCLKQGPGDGSPTQYGSDQTFADGGNSGVCTPGSGIVSANGTYSFKVTADAGGDHAEETVNVDVNTSGPGDVKDYNKTHSNSCEYTIHFKTAADAGKTVKVELYRADSVPFNADAGSRIQSIAIGSDTAKDTTDSPPDCSKTYYYAVRAFDSAGNGSALIGDDVSNITVVNPTGAPARSAIPVSSTNGNVLGVSTKGTTGASGTSGEKGQVEGLSTPSAETVTVTPAPKPSYFQEHKKRVLAIGGLLVLAGILAIYLWKRKGNSPE